jgi:hypothetical protein
LVARIEAAEISHVAYSANSSDIAELKTGIVAGETGI